MFFEPENVKGFQDFLPPESLKRAKIKEIIEKNFRLYGFLPVETATIEYDELMRSNTIGEEDEAISDRFRLKDRGGRNLGLRYEFTFQLSRMFKQNPNIKLPFKRYQIGKVFRDEPTGPGRFREFTQCDADIVGDSSINADAECLALINSIMKDLKIEPEIQINNRKLLAAIIESVKIENTKSAMKELDKIDKIGEDQVKANLRKYAETEQIITLFKLLSKDINFFTKNLFDGSEEVQQLIDLGKLYGIKISFNPFMIRGLSYYTGNIFEVVSKGVKGSLAGGGRYDKVVGRYLQKEIPAVGISFGIERIEQVTNIEAETTKTVLISIEKDKETISLANKLRKGNVTCSIIFGKPGKALDYANSYQIPFAIFIGKDEIEKKKFKLRNLQTGKEELLTEKQLIKKLGK